MYMPTYRWNFQKTFQGLAEVRLSVGSYHCPLTSGADGIADGAIVWKYSLRSLEEKFSRSTLDPIASPIRAADIANPGN